MQLNVLLNTHLRPQIIRCSGRCRWLKLCILDQVQLNHGLHIGWRERLFLTPNPLVAKLTSQLQNTYHERPFWTGSNNHATR